MVVFSFSRHIDSRQHGERQSRLAGLALGPAAAVKLGAFLLPATSVRGVGWLAVGGGGNALQCVVCTGLSAAAPVRPM